MTRRRSSPLGLELVVSVVLALVVLPLLSHGAPVQDAHADLQRYSEGCYYNYNHYSEGDRILTNEPCLNCTCHNKMLMCYLRVCPFTKPIGHDCTVEKREDQCCPIITCPEVPVDVSHHNTQMIAHESGTELSIPEKYGCSIDRKFYPEGAQVPSNPNKPCELCYCIRNRTSCLMQECTLHIDGCQPIYNKGSCCPVRYNCDHENELLELEDFSTTTTTVRPTPGYVLPSTTSPTVTTDCIHNNEVYADGALLTGKNACEHCYCMRGDIVCAVQECEMPTLESGAKTCRALPPAEGECCPSNYVCDDGTAPTEATLTEEVLTTLPPKIQSNLHESVSQEDVQLQEHIDDKQAAPEVPEKSPEHVDSEQGSGYGTISEQALGTTIAPTEDEEEDDSSSITTVSAIKETSYETTQSPIELTTTHKTEEGLEDSHIIIDQDKEYDSTQAPIEDDIVKDKEDKKSEVAEDATTAAPVSEETQEEGEAAPTKEDDIVSGQDESTTTSAESSEEAEIEKDEATPASPIEKDEATPATPIEKDEATPASPIEKDGATPASPIEKDEATPASPIEKDEATPASPTEKDEATPASPIEKDISSIVDATTIVPIEKIEQEAEEKDKLPATEAPPKASTTPATSSEEELAATTDSLAPSTEEEEEESSSESAEPSVGQDKIYQNIAEPSVDGTTVPPQYEMVTQGEDSHIIMPEIGDHKTEVADHDKKPKDEAELSTAAPIPATSADGEMKKDELPQITVDSTTIPSAISEMEEIATSKPLSTEAPKHELDVKADGTTIKPDQEATSQSESESVESEEASTEAIDLEALTTSRPSSIKEESTEDTVEDAQKPTEQGDEIPAIVQEITATSSKPVSEAIPKEEEEGTYQTTSVPALDSAIEDISGSGESQEEETSSEEEGQSTESSVEDVHKEVEPATTALPIVDVQKEVEEATTILPIIVSTAEKDASTILPSAAVDAEQEVKGQPEHDITDFTTITPSVSDAKTPTTDEDEVKGEPEKETVDSTSITPPSADSKVPISEEEKVKDLPGVDATTIIPSFADSTPIAGEEEDKAQPGQETPDLTTNAPSVVGAGEPISEEEAVKPVDSSKIFAEKSTPSPSRGEDSTTILPTIVDDEETKVPSAEEEDKLHREPEDDESTTVAPSIADNEVPSSEEDVKLHGKPEQGIVESEVPTSEEEVKPYGKPEQDDSATVPPSIADSGVPSSEEEDKVHEKPKEDESTTVAPSIADNEVPSSEEEDKLHEKPEQGIVDSTTVSPSSADSKVPSSEEEDKLHEKPEQGIEDSTTVAPSIVDSEVPSSEDEDKLHEKPEQGIDDSTTVAPSIADSKVPSSEEEDKLHEKPEQGIDDSTTVAPSIVESEVPSSEEEDKLHEKPEQGIEDSTTVAPSIADSGEPSSEEEDKLHEQPEQGIEDSTTVAPSIVESEVPSSEEEDKLHEKPEQGIDDSTTVAPSIADSKIPSSEEEDKLHEKPEQGIDDSTTVAPSIVESELPSSAEEVKPHGKPEQAIEDSTTVAPSIVESEVPSSEKEDKLHEKPEQGIEDSTTVAPSIADSKVPSSEEEDKLHEKPEQAIEDSTTVAPSIVESEVPSSEEEDKLHEKPEQGIDDSTTVAPSIADSKIPSSEEEDKLHEKPEQGIDDSTTVAPSIVESELPSSAEEVKPHGKPEQDDSTTVPPSIADSGVPSSEEEDKVHEKPEEDESTTVAPSIADNEVPSSEEEVKPYGKPEQDIPDLTIVTPSVVDSKAPSTKGEEETKKEPQQGFDDSTTIASAAIDEEDKQKAEEEDIHRTTLSPISSSDEDSSDVVEAEGSGEQLHDIIPSAIPGEGDCLVNDQTFANNATVPTSNECELSCSCISSIVVCQRVQCYEPPQPNNCVLDEASSNKCCPQYICGVDSFAEDQRTTTPEDIEDEEIQFTTLPPAKKYPELAGEPEIEGHGSVETVSTTVPSIDRIDQVPSDEVTTRKPEEEPTKSVQEEAGVPVKESSSEDEVAKTEQSAVLDAISTPSSIDIEMPIITPEEPMSHVKDDAATEPSSSSEESSEEDISTERPQISEDKIQPLPSVTAKPTQEVTGDTDELVQVAAAPEVPAKKPSGAEESTTLKAADEKEEELATVAPLGQGVSAGDDSVTVDSQTGSGKPIVPSEEISTESSYSGGAPKIDESILATEGTLEEEPTTTRPTESEISSEAPSLSSVLDSEGFDSTQSEEAPEESSSESGEETMESEEDTKLPSAHEKEAHITTVRPIASEQTTIKTTHTDLSGEIVPAESSTTIPEGDYQKPEMPEDMSHTKVEEEKPIGGEKSEESEESTEQTETVPPPKVPVSTVLTPVQPSKEDDKHKDVIPTAISDKKDDFPATEGSAIEKEEPLEQGSIGETQPISPTLAPSASEEESLPGTVAPISEIQPEVEKDETASQTTAPDVIDQSLSGTAAPVLEDDSQTIVPAIEKQPVTETSVPVSEDESEVKKDEIASQTSAPSVEQGAATPAVEAESEEEKEEIAGTTSAPALEIQPVTEILTSTSEDESGLEKDEIASQTSAPSIGQEEITPAEETESEQEKEEIAGPTSVPITEKQPIAATDSTPTEAESEEEKEQPIASTLAPSSQDASEEEKDEFVSQTAAPAQGLDERIIPQVTSPTTVSPAIEEADVLSSTTSSTEEETAKPTAEEKYPEVAEDKEPSVQIPLEEQEEEADITTISTIETGHVDSDATETPAISIPVKIVQTEDESLDTTETATGSSTIRTVEKEDGDLATTKSPADVELTLEDVSSSTQAPVPAVEKDDSSKGTEIPALSEESTPAVQTSEEESASPDTTLAPINADVSPSKADRGSEEDLAPELSTEKPVSDDKPAAHTDKPESIEDESSAESEKPISSTDAAIIPVAVAIDEVTAQPGKPDSDDQISVDEVSPTTVRPSIGEVPAQTESSLDEKVPEITEKEPSSEESSEETKKPTSETEKPLSVIDVAIVDKDTEKEDVEEPTSEQAVAQTESPIFVPKKEEDISAKPEGVTDEIAAQTEQPAAPASDDQQVTIDTTVKPAAETSETESEEEDEDKEVVSTVAPVDLAQQTSAPSISEAPIAPVESDATTASSVQSEEESEQTEAPKDDHKIQTVAEFVTERVDDRTTVLPILDTKPEKTPDQPVATSSEETSTSSSEEDEETEPEVTTTQKVVAVPTAEESDEKTSAPETPSEATAEEDQKSEETPTESVIPSTTSESPIVPAKEKFGTDLPKPIVTDEESSEEEGDLVPTSVHPLYPHIQLDATTLRPELNASEKIGADVHVSETTARPAYTPSSTLAPTTQQPTTSAPTSHFQPPNYGHVPPQYPSYTEDEYTDEDETEVFGPGTCRYGGKLFVSAQQIPRDDPCDFCFCFRSDIICLQQSCPPPISGCHEEPISGFCCPRYECPVSMATVLNITTSTTTTSTTLPPHFLHHAYRGAAEKNGCHINGKSYKVGDKIDSASGPCMRCTCGGDGQMKCDPKTCSPEPMLRQMIAVVASRRR